MARNDLPEGWRWARLEEAQMPGVKAIVSGPFGSNIGRRFFVPSGVPVIRGSNLTTDLRRFVEDGFVYVTEEKAEELATCEALRRDLVFTAAGTLGQVGIIPQDSRYPRYIISNKQLRARLDPNVVDPLFAFYWFASPRMVRHIEARNTGSSVPLINLSILRDLPLPVPPAREQNAIVHILSALDDKIELNRRMNETLEAMARAIFKSWFVDFLPVRAKADGRQPYGMDADTAALFPDSFQDSPLGKIPTGWSTASVYELADVVYGAPFSSRQFSDTDEGVPLLRIRDLKTQNPQLFTTEVHPKGTLVQPGHIVVGMDGEFRAYLWTGPASWLNQRVCMFRPANEQWRGYVFHALEAPLAFFERSKVGTTVIHLLKRDIDTIAVVRPPDEVLERFAATAEPLLDKVVANASESGMLATIRDTLLPKLMSGEVRVGDAEKAMEDVT